MAAKPARYKGRRLLRHLRHGDGRACLGQLRAGPGGDIKAVPLGEDPGDAPSEDHKQGIRLRVKMSDDCGGGVRECISLAAGFWHAFDRLHDAYVKELPEHPGKLPIVSISKMIETKTRQGSTFAPEFVIDGWIVRPGDLPPAAPKPVTKEAAAPAPAPKPKAADPNVPFNDPLPRFGS